MVSQSHAMLINRWWFGPVGAVAKPRVRCSRATLAFIDGPIQTCELWLTVCNVVLCALQLTWARFGLLLRISALRLWALMAAWILFGLLICLRPVGVLGWGWLPGVLQNSQGLLCVIMHASWLSLLV